MGICKVNNCCRECEVVRTGENFPNNTFNNNKGKIFLNNGKTLINNNQIILAKKYFELINKIRENPSDYINDSKTYNLFEIFIKLKPSKPLKFSDNNILNIISYLEEYQEKKSIFEKQNEISSMINQGNINKINLFQTITLTNNIEENFWYFLEENEDDIDIILSTNHEYIMIICLPIKDGKSIISFIFYNETH